MNNILNCATIAASQRPASRYVETIKNSVYKIAFAEGEIGRSGRDRHAARSRVGLTIGLPAQPGAGGVFVASPVTRGPSQVADRQDRPVIAERRHGAARSGRRRAVGRRRATLRGQARRTPRRLADAASLRPWLSSSRKDCWSEEAPRDFRASIHRGGRLRFDRDTRRARRHGGAPCRRTRDRRSGSCRPDGAAVRARRGRRNERTRIRSRRLRRGQRRAPRSHRRLLRQPILRRQIDHAVGLPFASPSAFLDGQRTAAVFRRSMGVAQSQHRAVAEAIIGREGARAEAIMREHARHARTNLETFMTATAT